MQLVANQHEPSGDGVGHQVEAGSHDNTDDAESDGGAWQSPRAAFKHLEERTERWTLTWTTTRERRFLMIYFEQDERRADGVQDVEVLHSSWTVHGKEVHREDELQKD